MTPQERADALVEAVARSLVIGYTSARSAVRHYAPVILEAAALLCDEHAQRADHPYRAAECARCAADLRTLAALCGAASPKPGAL